MKNEVLEHSNNNLTEDKIFETIRQKYYITVNEIISINAIKTAWKGLDKLIEAYNIFDYSKYLTEKRKIICVLTMGNTCNIADIDVTKIRLKTQLNGLLFFPLANYLYIKNEENKESCLGSISNWLHDSFNIDYTVSSLKTFTWYFGDNSLLYNEKDEIKWNMECCKDRGYEWKRKKIPNIFIKFCKNCKPEPEEIKQKKQSNQQQKNKKYNPHKYLFNSKLKSIALIISSTIIVFFSIFYFLNNRSIEEIKLELPIFKIDENKNIQEAKELIEQRYGRTPPFQPLISTGTLFTLTGINGDIHCSSTFGSEHTFKKTKKLIISGSGISIASKKKKKGRILIFKSRSGVEPLEIELPYYPESISVNKWTIIKKMVTPKHFTIFEDYYYIKGKFFKTDLKNHLSKNLEKIYDLFPELLKHDFSQILTIKPGETFTVELFPTEWAVVVHELSIKKGEE